MKKNKLQNAFITFGTKKSKTEINFNNNKFYKYGNDFYFLEFLNNSNHINKVKNLTYTIGGIRSKESIKGIPNKQLPYILSFKIIYKFYLLFKMLIAKNFVFAELDKKD